MNGHLSTTIASVCFQKKNFPSSEQDCVGSSIFTYFAMAYVGPPVGSVVKNPPANAPDAGLTPGSGRSPGEENGSPLQDSCLGNPMDRGAWRATVPGVAKIWTRLSN